MDTVEVTARFSRQGNVTPLEFIWRERAYPVEAVGRRWASDIGDHFLVMVPADQIVELIYSAATGRWFLKEVPQRRSIA